MEPIHIFCKELPADENNIFTANITEKNEVKNVRFDKFFEYAVTGLFINQDVCSALVTVTDIDQQNCLSNTIQKPVKERRDPGLDLKISNPETKDIIIPFQKKSGCTSIKLIFYNTATKKNEEIEFYNYLQHLQKFGFAWEHPLINFRCSKELSTDKLKLIKR